MRKAKSVSKVQITITIERTPNINFPSSTKKNMIKCQ